MLSAQLTVSNIEVMFLFAQWWHKFQFLYDILFLPVSSSSVQDFWVMFDYQMVKNW
jgi:hypothetical protein